MTGNFAMRVFAGLAVAALFATVAQDARADFVDDCVQSSDQDLKIGGCTAAIQSGQWSGKDLAWAYNNRGNAYRDLGEFRRAIEDYDQALQLDPGVAAAYSNRGIAYAELGELRRAIEDFDQALRLDPEDAVAYHNRGTAYRALGAYERAVEDWERAIGIEGASRVERWQNLMTGTGHYAGAIDGVYGPDTQRALMACAVDPDC